MKTVIFLLIINSNYLLSIIFLPGSGSKNDPYQITNIEELQSIATYAGTSRENMIYFSIMNDIDASITRTWNVGDHDRDPSTPDEPMGFKPLGIMYFHHNEYIYIYGNGHIIKNLYINMPGYSFIGFFSRMMDGGLKQLGLENCEILGDSYVGSFCGEALSRPEFSECYSTGSVSGKHWSIGGFSPSIENYKVIQNCYTTCSVITRDTNKYSYFIYAFSGSWGCMSKCYAAGKVLSNGLKGVFCVGENAYSSYWDTEVTGIPDSGKGVARGYPTSEMMKKSTYSWDFEKVWCIEEGKSYPKLRVFGKCSPDAVEYNKQSHESIKISPNPAGEYIEITGIRVNPRVNPWVNAGVGEIRIYDVLGECVLTTPSLRDTPSEKGNIRIDVSGLPPGIYFVRLGDWTGSFMKIE